MSPQSVEPKRRLATVLVADAVGFSRRLTRPQIELLALLGAFLGTFTTVLRALLGFDETRRQLALSFAAALFVIGFVAPGVSELLALRPEGSSMVGAILGLTARPLFESLMHLANSLRQDALAILRSWISRRWD